MKIVRVLSVMMLAVAAPALMQAQGGCVNSPENPTALLGLVGAAGMGWSCWRARSKR